MGKQSIKTAVVQLNADNNLNRNVENAVHLVRKAIAAKAQLIALPEVFNFRGHMGKRSVRREVAENISGRSLTPLRELAKTHRVFVLVGSFYEKVRASHKIYNTSVLINPKGEIQVKYRKINLFNAIIGKTKILESKVFLEGKTKVLTRVESFNLGLSICYDLRFPSLYKTYANMGAHILSVPASFTQKTGEAHWEVLLRARAVENLCYVIAPNQVGMDGNGVPSYGNSMIVSPWGEVLARAGGKREEVITAVLDMKEIKSARAKLPGINKNGNPSRRIGCQ